MEQHSPTYYKQKRDSNLKIKPLAAFYQILILKETEKGKFSFYKKSALMQLWQILNEMLDGFLETDDVDYRKGICQEVFLAARDYCPSDEECRICSSHFVKSRIQKYVNEVYQIHISGIIEMANDDIEAAQMYSDNLLLFLEARYGADSVEYARMKLHIIGECFYWHKREEFFCTFRDNYDYFRQYTMQKDMFFFDAFSCYIYLLGAREDEDYGLWMERFQEDLEQRQRDELYCFFQCKIAWVKAKMLEKKKQNVEGFTLIQNAIQKYLYKDSDGYRLFYARVYLTAAYFAEEMSENEKMLYYAQKGLELCEKINQVGSEVYYNLYNYIGIWHMREQDWEEAGKLYSNAISEIVRKFGKENENYVTYMSNLALVAISRGRDAELYFKELRGIKSEELRKKYRLSMNNELNISISRGDSIDKTRRVYEGLISNLTGEKDREERERLDTLYVSARVNLGKFNKKTEELLRSLEQRYGNRFSDEIAIIYWNSRSVWEWHVGNLHVALEIAERLMQEIKISDYLKYILPVLNDIQLLIIHGQYEKARKRIFSVWGVLDETILKIGFGNLSNCLFYMRTLLSMYIHMLKKGGDILQIEDAETKQLLEKVIRCKTVEREIKGLIGKYSDEEMDLYYFKMAHRKLAALEMAYEKGNFERSEYKKRKKKCLMELGEYEPSVSRRIPFRELIHAYKFEEIKVPHTALCAEYFAYYNFLIDEPMYGAEWEDNEIESYNYLVFILGEKSGQVKILEIADIPYDKAMEKDIHSLLDVTLHKAVYDEAEIEQIGVRLNQRFAEPVLRHVKGKERLYLGLDFEMQMLPVDIIFYDERGESLINILVDSVCYVGTDTEIDMGKSNALIIGNPKFKLHGEQVTFPLPCGELECGIIAGMFGTEAYIGKDASQKVLWGKGIRDIIHISTHGEYCVPKEAIKKLLFGNVFIYSFLKFAGYEDWKSGERDKDYGNGFISGDDFLFMDLSGTKLVVLSACVSGLGNTTGLDTMHGLRWAISAAGAENSITTIWKVPDAVAAILMLLFYRNLFTTPVGDALYQAKRRLRTITVAELREDEELWEIIETAKKDTEDPYWQEVTEEDTPFSHWYFWAGFVCYHR